MGTATITSLVSDLLGGRPDASEGPGALAAGYFSRAMREFRQALDIAGRILA